MATDNDFCNPNDGCGVPATPLSSPWIPFSERMPEPAYDRNAPDKPTHGKILVTNNLEAVNRWGKKSHVWLVSMVHYHERDVFSSAFGIQEQTAFAGEITAFDDRDKSIRLLTHWRPAFPEEWPELITSAADNNRESKP